MVPVTLVLRLMASTELRLCQTTLPSLIISKTIWFKWTRPRWSPLGLMQNVPCAPSRNPEYPCYSHDTVRVIREFGWYCTGLSFHNRYPVFILLSVCSVLVSVLLLIRLFNLFCFGSIRFVRLFVYWVLFSVLCLELYSRYFDPIILKEVTCYHYQPSSKSINMSDSDLV